MMVRRFLSVVAMCGLGLGIAPDAWAGEHVHKLRKGETLESLAESYYGTEKKASYLRVRNQLIDKEPKPGDGIFIPGVWSYRIRKGDSLGSIAKKYLGDLDRYTALMEANGIKQASDLEVGQDILMPFHLFYRLKGKEGYGEASRHVYGTTRYGPMLSRYNKDRPARPGLTVVVPVFDRATRNPEDRVPDAPGSSWNIIPKLVKTATDAAKQATSGGGDSEDDEDTTSENDSQPSTESAMLEQYRKTFDRGYLQEACEGLDELFAPKSSVKEDPTLLRYLVYCAIAEGDQHAALLFAEALLRAAPRATYSRDAQPPAFMDAISKAKQSARR